MESTSTDSLRRLSAPSWTLAGDELLLTLLQNVHQRILSKCQEVNTKLDEMTSSLDGSSIDLQNVNNKFMSLSNRQFIESRVYEDDADLTTPTYTNKEQPKPPALDELSILKNGLAILESTHETAEIIDDSDSDSDVEISVVLKPKDVYSHRPLPYIIGSQQWRDKWHAGLIIETSDTDSLPSKGHSDVEYSDSEVEDLQTDLHNDNTISESSSLLHSYRDREPDRVTERNADLDPNRTPDRGLDRRPPPTAAEVAANIANVMARTQPLIERPATPPTPPQYTPAKPPAVYRPTQPLPSRVFPDEPPPLDLRQHSSSSSQEDIFAEINKNIPYNQGVKVQSGISDDLFGKTEREDVFGVPYDESSSYFRDEPATLKQKPLIKERIESKSVEQPENISKDNIEENITKKPIGGISLFGTNKDTDTIGAAILKRNIRKSATTEEIGSDVSAKNNIKTDMAAESQNIDEIDNRKAEKDIFENLFAKSNEANNKSPKNNKKEQKTIVNTEKKQKKDLFADNIFNDVDDIFSSDIKVPSKTNKPSLFDDDDDLFTDIAKSDANVSKTQNTKPQTVKSNLFDSDDELFSDIKTNKTDQEDKTASKTVHPTVESKIENVTKNDNHNEKVSPNIAQVKQTISKTTQPEGTNKVVENNKKPKAISIFDSDSDEDIFNFNKSAPKSNIENSSAKSKLKTEETKIFQSPLLFDDDEEDELFSDIDKNKVDPEKEHTSIDIQEQKKNDPITDEIESKTIIPETDSLLLKNVEESFETKIVNNNVSNDKFDAIESKAQSSNSIETTPSTNLFTANKISKNTNVTDIKNIVEETKAPNLEEIIQPYSLENETVSNANVEITPSDISTNDQLEVTHSDKDNKAKETSKPKPEVPIFDGHLSDDFEPPPFEATIEPIGHIAEETPMFIEQKNNIATQKAEIPIFDIQTENVANNIPPEVPGFDDIVSEPPIFEKVKEPKKSKNVNALFDDDSEDEALFFKKNDVISDEKPDVFSKPANFGLFTDEPPPADFENDLFGSKHVPEPILKDRDIESSKIDEKVDPHIGISSKIDIPKNKLIPAQSLFGNDSDDDIFSFNKASTSITTKESSLNFEDNSKIKESGQISTKTDTIVEQKSIFDDLDDNLFTTQHNINQTPDHNSVKKETDTKKIGKLTTNLNINVQALIPGASPKKSKLEKVETEPAIVKPIDTESEPIDTEPKMVKSVSFEEEPERGVLDNNASKQRAKIQVKRRPSSRQARHEAVRKSALDLDPNVEQNYETNDKKSSTNYLNSPKLDDKNIKHDSPIDSPLISHEKIDQFNQYANITQQNSNLNANVTIDAIHDNAQRNTNEIINKTQGTQSQNQNSQTVDNQNEKSTKVVYVLNDEDIFTNLIKNDTVRNETPSTSKSNEETVDSATKVNARTTKFEEKTTKVEEKTPNLEENPTKHDEKPTKFEENQIKPKENTTKPKGNTTKPEGNTPKPTKKISLFDSDDDETDSLFKTKPSNVETTKNKPVNVKKTKNTKLFDSDSEDDLFKTKPNVKENVKVLKKSLFDDDGDDLFGAKPKTQLENKSEQSREKVEEKKDTSKPIFADPLSLFGDDDD